MKEVVSKFIRTFGCETGYSGAARIMYIKGERAQDALRAVRDKWPTLAFYVRVTEAIPEAAQEPLTSVQEALLPIVKDLINSLPADTKAEVVGKIIDDAVTYEKNTLAQIAEGIPATREQVDAYLISHPIDRKAKGPYNDAAKALNVKVDYVRDRYRKLREKGLVETETVNA
jgi:hypothetical protein